MDRQILATLASPGSCLCVVSFSLYLPTLPPRQVAVPPHCHSHHHQSANCWPWERTSLRLVIPFLHLASSHSPPTFHTQSSHFSHFHTTLSPSFVFLIVCFFESPPYSPLTLPPSLPPSVSCKLIFSLCTVNVWLGQCCVPGWNPFCIQ